MLKNNFHTCFIAIFLIFGCQNSKKPQQYYENQIGDTPFDKTRDNPSFKFCDSTKVLHKRAYITYSGGKKALEEELIKKYIFQPNYKTFSGYFIIRFAVNCNNETGRFRMEVLDTNFTKTNCPEDLKNHILSLSKSLKNWNHVFYRGKDYDGYRFINIKMKHGKIVKS
jgi:hypothetical protein